MQTETKDWLIQSLLLLLLICSKYHNRGATLTGFFSLQMPVIGHWCGLPTGEVSSGHLVSSHLRLAYGLLVESYSASFFQMCRDFPDFKIPFGLSIFSVLKYELIDSHIKSGRGIYKLTLFGHHADRNERLINPVTVAPLIDMRQIPQ